MGHDIFVTRLILAVAVGLLMTGAVSAWVSANAAKRLAGVALAGLGAWMALAAMGAPNALLIAGVAVAFAQLAVGVAVLVRVQEGYGAIEAPELDQADRQDDTLGPPQ